MIIGAVIWLAAISTPVRAQTAPPAAQPNQQTQQFPEQPLAVDSMSRQELRDAVTQLRAFVVNGGVRAGGRPEGCASTEQRQLDFWLGEWDVSPTGSDQVIVGESTISQHAQGCMLEEFWRPFRGAEGRSINGYNAADQRWHQYYIDATGRHTQYSGEFRDGVMSLENMSGVGPGVVTGVRARMNFQMIDGNTVRQWGENLNAGDDTWTITWDLTYRRRPHSGVIH